MHWYYPIAWVVIAMQLFFVSQAVRNYRYALARLKKNPPSHQPPAALMVPCKGLVPQFQRNVTSFFNQDYENYTLYFVVADPSDPAYEQLKKLKSQLSKSSKAKYIHILIAGHSASSSEKLHNLLYCSRAVPPDVEILAFADSDIHVQPDWLRHLIWPLRSPKNGASTGYRWFVPASGNLATLALSAINAKITQLLGNTRFNLAWGGSMAIRTQDFRRLNIDKIWQTTVSDDLSLSRAVKKAGMKVAFVPTCLVSSYESTTWRNLFEFARRQLLLARIYTPRTWWFGCAATVGSVLALWGSIVLAAYAAAIDTKHLLFLAGVPVICLASQLVRALLRQKMAGTLLKEDLPQMKSAMVADILGFWLWSLLLCCFVVSSAFGRTIRWRGTRYRLVSPTKTIVLRN